MNEETESLIPYIRPVFSNIRQHQPSPLDFLRNAYSMALDVVEATERYIAAADANDDDEWDNAWDAMTERIDDFREMLRG